MKPPRILVDFNEMIEPDLVLLAKTDSRTDSSGNTILLTEGQLVLLYAEDISFDGQFIDNLIAEGVVERNSSCATWSRQAKWCCRITGKGIQHESQNTQTIKSKKTLDKKSRNLGSDFN